MKGRRRQLLFLLSILLIGFGSLADIYSAELKASSDYLTPRNPQVPKVTSVEQLLPNARLYVRGADQGSQKPALALKGGEKVLLIWDNTMDPLVLEALTRAIRELPGTKLDVINFHGFTELTDTVDVLEKVLLANWWPDWLWQAMSRYDVVVQASRIVIHYLPPDWREGRVKTRLVRMPYVTRELLAADTISFPEELYAAINAKVWEQLKGAKEIRITDPLGTDLRVALDEEYWKFWMEKRPMGGRLPYNPGHITVSPALLKPRANGVLVVTALHTGLIPRIKLTIENSQITKIEGGGRFAEVLKAANEKHKDIQYPGYPGPGINWLEEISLGTQPRAIRASNWQELRGMARWAAYAQARSRSGVLHIAFGTAGVSGTEGTLANFLKERGLILNHRDTELYHATYVADGRVIVKDGHLMALDDPEIRKIAAKYGDPDQLLSEAWIPEVGK